MERSFLQPVEDSIASVVRWFTSFETRRLFPRPPRSSVMLRNVAAGCRPSNSMPDHFCF